MTGEGRPRNGFVDRFDDVNRKANGAMAVAGAVALLGIMVVTVGNMALRTLGAPFAGAFEVVGWLAAICNGLAVGYTQTKDGHVSIDVLTRLMAPRVQAVLRSVIAAVAAVLFAVVTWQMLGYGLRLRAVGTVSDVMRVTYYPFPLLVSLGFAGLTVALVANLLRDLRDVPRLPGRRDGGDSGESSQ